MESKGGVGGCCNIGKCGSGTRSFGELSSGGDVDSDSAGISDAALCLRRLDNEEFNEEEKEEDNEEET